MDYDCTTQIPFEKIADTDWAISKMQILIQLKIKSDTIVKVECKYLDFISRNFRGIYHSVIQFDILNQTPPLP